MKKLSTYILEHKWGYLLGLISMLISICLDMLSPQLTKRIIDEVITLGQLDKLGYLLGGILCVGVGRCIFQYIKEFVFDKMGSKIACDLRMDLFTHIQGLSTEFFDKNNTGELMSRVKDDVDRIWESLSYVIMLIIEVVVHTSIVLFCMYRLNPKLALIPTIGMLICGFVAFRMEHKLGSVYEEISEENAVLNTVAEENLAGVRTVKAFAREKYEIKKFLSHNKRYYDLNMRQSKIFVRFYPYFQVITKLLPIIIILLGGRFVIQDEMSLGSLGAFVEYSMNIVWPMEMLGWLSNSISSAVASYKKIKKIYDNQPTVHEPVHPTTSANINGKIEFANVSFHKEDKHPILSDISFVVESGKSIGIMGATGSGKTSLIYLLQRLYDTTNGVIRIDDIPIQQMSFQQLRGNISLVMQDIFLFSDTISENVKLGKRDYINMDTILSSAKAAHAHDFIARMENQYETIIGERGVGLSGGQKQRISIARALAKHCPILVMDDSTSALDMETEHLIHKTLNELDGVTKLIIAHRISAVRHADEIIVLEDGCIKERGTHQTLMEQKGSYYETFLSQYGDSFLQKEVI